MLFVFVAASLGAARADVVHSGGDQLVVAAGDAEPCAPDHCPPGSCDTDESEDEVVHALHLGAGPSCLEPGPTGPTASSLPPSLDADVPYRPPIA